MRITSKGQVTIPQSVREKAGFMPNTEVDFVFEGRKVVIVKAKPGGTKNRGQDLIARMRQARTIGLSTDEIMRLTRGEV